MFIVCKACDGSGEGVYGHSWTTCPVCNGAGQIVDPAVVPPLPFHDLPVVKVPASRVVRESRVSIRRELGIHDDNDPTGVFPDPMKRRAPVAA